MLSILCALFALIVLMRCAAVRAARAMRSGPGTEAQATRLDLSTEAQATQADLSTEAQATQADLSTEAQATSTGRPSGRKPKPPLPPLRKVGRRKTAARKFPVPSSQFQVPLRKVGRRKTAARAASRPAGRAQRPRPLNRGPPPAWTALLLDFHLSRPQGVGPLSQVGAWEFLRSDVHCYP
jgi:hypothetical protein